MAARANGFAQVFLGLFFLLCFIVVFEQQCSQRCCLAPLVQSASFSPPLQPRYFGFTVASHLREWERISRWQFSIIRSLVHTRWIDGFSDGDSREHPQPSWTP